MSTDIDITLPDYIAIRNIAFEWGESYDTKDWKRLQQILAPSIRLDFSGLGGVLHNDLTPAEYAEILKGLIGDPCVKTQHFLGASKWERMNDEGVIVSYQARVAHQRYESPPEGFASSVRVVNKGHGHGVVQHGYQKIDGVWKLQFSSSGLHWSEYDLFGTLNSEEGKAGVAEEAAPK